MYTSIQFEKGRLLKTFHSARQALLDLTMQAVRMVSWKNVEKRKEKQATFPRNEIRWLKRARGIEKEDHSSNQICSNTSLTPEKKTIENAIEERGDNEHEIYFTNKYYY